MGRLETLGFVELTNDLAEMASKLAGEQGGAFAKTAQSILDDAAQPVLSAALRFAPVRSGVLHGAIKAGKVKRRKDGGYTITIGSHKEDDAYYASWVEFGHGGPHPAPPHPFMRPAYDATRDEAYNIIRTRLQREIDKIGG